MTRLYPSARAVLAGKKVPEEPPRPAETKNGPLGSAKAEELGIALLKALRAGDVAEVARLLSEGADPNAVDNNGETPLHIVPGRNPELAPVLLAAGA